MSVKSPGNGAGGLAALANYTTGTFTITLTGVSGTATGTASYVLMGNKVTLYIPVLSGTSNSTSKGLSGIPALIRPANPQRFFQQVVDPTVTSMIGFLRIASDGTASMQIAAPSTNVFSATGFTNTGAFSTAENTVTYVLS
jgi:hypothetical protein